MKKFGSNNLILPTNRAAYSDRTAYVMSLCAREAYRYAAAESIIGWGTFVFLRLSPTKVFEGWNQNSAYLAVGKTYAVLAFKGTVLSEAGTVETDLDFKFVRSRYGKIHQGFLEAYESIRLEIDRAVARLDVPLYITGHSLGGALALVASTFMKDQDKVAACYTFGCPRVGNERFTDHLFKIPVYRCVHAADVVPTVPFLSMGYRHYGDVRYLSDNGNVYLGSAAVVRRAGALANPLNWLGMVGDHSIQEYIRILRKYAEKRNCRISAA